MIKVHSIVVPASSPDTGQLVLRRSDLKSLLTLEELRLGAQKKVNLMLQEAQSECDSIRASAYQQAFEEGQAEANRLILSTMAKMTLFRRNSAETVCEILREMMSKLLGEMDPAEITEKIVHQGLKKIPGVESVRIRVPTNMESELNQRVDAIAAKFPEVQLITVVPDVALDTSLGCVLESPMGMIDASVSTQLEVLESIFDDVLNEEFSDESSPNSGASSELPDKCRSTYTGDNAT